ncbi:MAG: helix-turn-helix domain-containing protein [Clostridia bacterium]|nr:helix-turn-helix domain-containing protein [Clostridia bacterium]
MKILVINGSPKGQNSVTLQYVKYLAKISKNHEKLGADFDVLDVGKTVYSLSKPDKLQVVLDSISSADMLLFSYPVYTFLAPSQLHKFFEILLDNHVDLSGKYVTQLTTSKKFYDVTAHRAVRDMILSLGGKYIGGYSADMDDLLKEDLRENFVEWWRYVHFQIENDKEMKIREAMEPLLSGYFSLLEKQGFELPFITNEIIIKALQHIHTEPADVCTRSLAQRLNIDESYFIRLFSSVVELTPMKYIRAYRVSKAKELIQNGESVAVAAEKCGYASPSSFYNAVKAELNMSPSELKTNN